MKRILSFVLCAAMLLSSIVFVTSAADSEVQAVINKINAIGEVHRNEALLEDQTINGQQFNLSIDSDFGYNTCYYRVDYPTGSYMVNGDNWRDTLLWDRSFQISFQFSIKEHAGTAYFGGCLGNVAWVGYMYNDGRNASKYDQRFFVAQSTGEAPASPGTYCIISDKFEFDPDKMYTMTAVFDSTSIRIYCDGVLMCDTINASREKLQLKFLPKAESYVGQWGPQQNWHFHLYPAKTVSYIRSFEAKSLDGTINVHSLDKNIAANATWKDETFVRDCYVDSYYDIMDAKAAYMALTPPQKKEVTNYATLVSAFRQYYTTTPLYTNDGSTTLPISAEALAVVDLIDAIGVVTPSSESDIYTAEAEYDALTPEQQAEVYNYDVLLCSREEFDAFSDPDITQLVADINAIAPVTLASGTAIARAEADYAAFNPSQKAAVTNYADLLTYRAQYDTLCVEHVREVWNSIGVVTKDSGAIMAEARQVWNDLREDLRPRVADVKPIFDAAKTDFRILNLDECDLNNTVAGNDKGRWEIEATAEYYEVQSYEAKDLVKNKAYLDERVAEANYMAQAEDIVKQVNSIGNVKFMEEGGSANGLEFAAKSNQGYSNALIRQPAGSSTSAGLFSPYTVSYDIIIKKWLYNEDDMTARIAAFLPNLCVGYNGVEKKFMIGKAMGFAGQGNITGEYATSDVVELKPGVPYNITFEIDENHVAIYLNGKKMVETKEIGLHRREQYINEQGKLVEDGEQWFIFYPGGVNFLVTGYTFIHNGEVFADHLASNSLLSPSGWTLGEDGGWKSGAVANFNDVYRDSGYIVETAYNRYMALPDKYKTYVTNSATLIEKYNSYISLKNVQLVTDAIDAITAIGDPAAVTLESLEAIKAAEYAYREVPEDKKGEVTNYDALVTARGNYDVLYAADFDARVNAIGAVSADKFEAIEGLKAEYDAMSDAQKALVTSLETLNSLLADCAEFYKAQPVIEAIYSFQGLKTANYNDTTPIGGNVRVTNGDPYTHYDKAGGEGKGIIGTGRFQIDFDFLYTGYDDGRFATIGGSNKQVVAGVDVGHGLVYIKNNTDSFATPDPETYDAKDPYVFRTNRWYHVTVKYDALRISVEINGEERVHLDLSEFDAGPYYIMKPHGGVHGYVDNMSASTLVPEDELEDGFVRTVYQEWSGGSDNAEIPQTTIGQWNRDNVAKARAMYNELSPFARTAVTNYKTLTDTEKLLGISAPSDAAMAVIDAINALDKDSSVEDINTVNAQYEALSAADKKAVTNYAKIGELLAALQSEEMVNAVIDAINALSETSPIADIIAADAAYEALPAANKSKVTNYSRIAELYTAKAQQVTDMISALTTESSDEDITAASVAYDALPDAVKAQVTNYDHLSAIIAEKSDVLAASTVEAMINALDSTSSYEDVKAADDAYAGLTDAQKALVTNYAKIGELYAAMAKTVEDMIAALSNTSSDADIEAAEAAYTALPAALKSLVPNYAHLEEVKNSRVSEEVTKVIEAIMELDVNSSVDKFKAAIAAYNALSDADKAKVFNYDTLLQLIDDKAAAIDADILRDVPEDAWLVDIYHYEANVKKYMNSYNALPDEVKAKIQYYDRLKAASDKIDSLHEWYNNKKVNILNSTLAGFGKYTSEQIAEMANQRSIGIYYYFEEVDMIERGDRTTGYYSLETDKDNALVLTEKYAKLELDIKVTDVDLINGWPAFFKMTTGFDTGYIGYDFVNKSFFHSGVGGGGGGGMDHGYLAAPYTSVPYDFEFGVWHHMVLTWDATSAIIEFDGVKVLDCETSDLFQFLIIYPWLCNLEMTNVHYYTKDGTDTLSPFRNQTNNPTGWSKSTNDEDATMLVLLEEAVAEAKAAYNKLSAEEKEQIVGYENIEKLEKMIANVGKYEVTVESGSADVEFAAEGDTVTVTAAAAPEGMVFDKWEIVSGEITLDNANAATAKFTMPGTAVSLKATYKEGSLMPGDVDGNGKLNAKDVTAIMKHLVGSTPKNFNADAADYDGNGKINAKDVTKLMKDMVSKA